MENLRMTQNRNTVAAAQLTFQASARATKTAFPSGNQDSSSAFSCRTEVRSDPISRITTGPAVSVSSPRSACIKASGIVVSDNEGDFAGLKIVNPVWPGT